jgi:hypothetical protein
MDNDKFVEELARKYACAVAISEKDGWYFPNCETQVTMLANREDCRRDHNLFTRAIREAMAHAYRDAAAVVRSLKTGGHWQNDNTREEAALVLERKGGLVEGEAAPAPQAATPSWKYACPNGHDHKLNSGYAGPYCATCNVAAVHVDIVSQAEAPRPSAPNPICVACEYERDGGTRGTLTHACQRVAESRPSAPNDEPWSYDELGLRYWAVVDERNALIAKVKELESRPSAEALEHSLKCVCAECMRLSDNTIIRLNLKQFWKEPYARQVMIRYAEWMQERITRP